MRDQVQIVIAHKSQNESSLSANILSANTWRVADASTKLELIEAGLGWGFLPLDRVKSGLKSKTLNQLSLEEYGPEPKVVQLSCITQANVPRGPATQWIWNELRNICNGN